MIRDYLILPLLFLLSFVCVITVLALLCLLSLWGISFPLEQAMALTSALQRLPVCLLDALIPSMIISIILLSFRMVRRPASRFLSLLIPLAASYLILVNGFTWLTSLDAKTRKPPADPLQYLIPGVFTEAGDAVICIERREGKNLEGVLLVKLRTSDKRFNMFPRGTATASNNELILALAEPKPVELRMTAGPVFAGIFQPGRFLRIFFEDIAFLTSDFISLLARARAQFYFACFSLLFLFFASTFIMRLTRWPLFNLMLMFSLMRGYFFLYRFLRMDIASALAKVFEDALFTKLFPSVVMIGFGVIFLLLDILFIPADRWTREIMGE